MSCRSRRDGNLPSTATSFIGRRQQRRPAGGRTAGELDRAGGVGKTRLALQVADEVNHPFENGVYVVELASALGGSDVPAAVVHTLYGVWIFELR